jgi:hypothetical protein
MMENSNPCSHFNCRGTAYRIHLTDPKWSNDRRTMKRLYEQANGSPYWRAVGAPYGSAINGLLAYENRGLIKIYRCQKCHDLQVSNF